MAQENTAKVIFRRGKKSSLPETKVDGQLLITTDEGGLYFDYKDDDGTLVRKQIGGPSSNLKGKLYIGDQTYDGSQDITIGTYNGLVD